MRFYIQGRLYLCIDVYPKQDWNGKPRDRHHVQLEIFKNRNNMCKKIYGCTETHASNGEQCPTYHVNWRASDVYIRQMILHRRHWRSVAGNHKHKPLKKAEPFEICAGVTNGRNLQKKPEKTRSGKRGAHTQEGAEAKGWRAT